MKQQKENDEFIITILLKGGKGKKCELDAEFAKRIENEYAVRYLEYMRINPTHNAIIRLLKTNPLSSCEMSSTWNSTGWLADQVIIYPMRTKKSFNETHNPQTTNKKDYEYKKCKTKEKKIDEMDIHDFSRLNPGGLIDKSTKLLENINIYRKNPNRDHFEESDKEGDEAVKKRDLKLNLKYWK